MDITIISKLGLSPDALRGETVIVTGAGGGIGYEAARALLWLGANIVIAELNYDSGKYAVEKLGREFGSDRVLFVQTDIGDASSIQNLYIKSTKQFGKVDAVINNATIAVLGTVVEVPIEKWDASYSVNLRGPVLMARTFLPDMLHRRHGVFICVSSTGTAFLGGYETFKAAQVHLANTLDAELEDTGVYSFAIGPGLVPTNTACQAVDHLAPLLGLTVEEFFTMNKNMVLTPEEAGAGFAVSIIFAERFKGTEISSIQALKAADINFGSGKTHNETERMNIEQRNITLELCTKVLFTLKEQSDGWKQRSIFERQWVIRDFRKTAGMAAEEWLDTLTQLESNLKRNEISEKPPLEKLAGYYNHLAELAKGFEKDAAKLKENLIHVYGWKSEVDQLIKILG